MLTLFGESIHSPFRLTQLLAKLNAAEPQAMVSAVHSETVYFIDSQTPLNATEQQLLQQLLSATTTAQLTADPTHSLTLVVPRLGTISPWSSKATCIAHVCGVSPIQRIERGIIYHLALKDAKKIPELQGYLHDRMTESVLMNLADAQALFAHTSPRTFTEIPLLEQGLPVLMQVNQTLGLALSADEMQYLLDSFQALGRNPSDLELMMFAQANSEHCRHKIFNATWVLDGKTQERSLFDMIRYTFQCHPEGVLSAYRDNGAVLAGQPARRWLLNPHTHTYAEVLEPCHIVIKVETHNHPTAIAPTEGAATGAGGEIRDEGAVGRGAKPKAGLVGFTVSNLGIPELAQPWEAGGGHQLRPNYLASALDIMLEGPIGAAAFNNEFGRPSLCGYFRTYEMGHYGYHKPIMIAGGLGNVRAEAASKADGRAD